MNLCDGVHSQARTYVLFLSEKFVFMIFCERRQGKEYGCSLCCFGNSSDLEENRKCILANFNIYIYLFLYIYIYIYIYMRLSVYIYILAWLQIRRPGCDSRHYQEKKVAGLEWGALSLVSVTDELLGRKSSGSGGRSVGIVRSRTQTMEFLYIYIYTQIKIIIINNNNFVCYI
jgi:hypothetical protein